MEEFLLTLVALVGSFLIAIWMAARQRLSLTVRGEDGKPSEALSSYLSALLQDLGGYQARGLEIPRGADATGLDNVPLAPTLNNGVLTALQKTLQMIFSLAPWSVAIDCRTKETLSVVITRNGWSAGAVSIDSNNELLFPLALTEGSPANSMRKASAVPQAGEQTPAEPHPKIDLCKMAAAFTVATLSRNYEGYEGLGGATDWRGIGLQFIATTDFSGDTYKEKILLAHALELDPGNLLAEAALRNLAYRHPQEPPSTLLTEKQKDYANWLIVQAGTLHRGARGRRALLYRLWFSYLCVALNLRASGVELGPEQGLSPEKVSGLLMRALTKSYPETEALERRMRPHAALAYVDINNKEQPEVEEWKAWYQEATSSLAPALAYNSACSLAYRKEDWAKVKARLDTAFQDTRLKTAAPYDPELLKYAEARPDAKKYLLSLKNKKPTGWWAQFLSAVGF